MKIRHAILMLLALGNSLEAAILSGPITNPANHHTYYLLTQSSWSDSESEAQALGGHLVTINDAAEQSFVYTNFATLGGTNHHLWIGLHRGNSGFYWVTGEPVTYTHWAPDEPNNCDGVEDSGVIFGPDPGYLQVAGYWNDLSEAGYGGCGGGFLGPYGVVEVEFKMTIVCSAVDVCWSSLSNHNYQVEYLSNALSNQWTALGISVLATNTTTCVTDIIRNKLQRFYRVVQLD
jgi:hypothetical protein